MTRSEVPALLSVAPRHLRKLADAIDERRVAERNLYVKAREGREGPQDKRRYKAALDNLAAVIEEIKVQTP
jgi:hypothetical protein